MKSFGVKHLLTSVAVTAALTLTLTLTFALATPNDLLAQKKKVLRIAGMNPPDYPATKQMYELKKVIDEGTEGRYELKVFPSNQLGDYVQVYEEIMRGSIDLAQITIPSQFDKRLELNFFPYLAETFADLEKRFSQDGYVYKTLDKVHAELGVKLLGFSVEGMAGVGSTKEIMSPADWTVAKGVLLRCAPIDAIKEGLMAMGFQTMSLPYAELYTALQTGIVDAFECGPIGLTYLTFRDVTKYYYQYNNYVECNQWIMNKKLFDGMTEQDQNLIVDAVANYQQQSINEAEASEIDFAAKVTESGIKVVAFSDEEMHKIANHVRETVWPKLKDQVGDQIYNGLMEAYKN